MSIPLSMFYNVTQCHSFFSCIPYFDTSGHHILTVCPSFGWSSCWSFALCTPVIFHAYTRIYTSRLVDFDSVAQRYLLCLSSNLAISDFVFVTNPQNPSQPSVFTSIKFLLHVFSNCTWFTSSTNSISEAVKKAAKSRTSYAAMSAVHDILCVRLQYEQVNMQHYIRKSAQRDANTARPPQSPHRRTESAMAV